MRTHGVFSALICAVFMASSDVSDVRAQSDFRVGRPDRLGMPAAERSPISPLARGMVYFTNGKYKRGNLALQWVYCQNLEQCEGCMKTRYPNSINPFDNGNNNNCEGVIPFANWWYKYPAYDGVWENFFIPSSKQVLQGVINQCQQNLDDVHCTEYVDDAHPYVDFYGAYLLGDEFELGQMDSQYIDRFTIGDRGLPLQTADWLALRNYAALAAHDLKPHGYRGWYIMTFAAARMMIDASPGFPAKPAGEAETTLDFEFAKSVFIHCLVAQQSWEWFFGEEDWLSQAGVSAFWDDPDLSPTFVWYIHYQTRDIVGTRVNVEAQSWSNVKRLYRD